MSSIQDSAGLLNKVEKKRIVKSLRNTKHTKIPKKINETFLSKIGQIRFLKKMVDLKLKMLAIFCNEFAIHITKKLGFWMKKLFSVKNHYLSKIFAFESQYTLYNKIL